MAKQKTEKSSRKTRRGAEKSPEVVEKAFGACPRCCFFLAGYRLIHNDFEQATENSVGNWIGLTWNSESRKLILKSYGYQIQEDDFHFEGVCCECRRVFVFRAPATRRQIESFQIQIYPS